jgi:hypothetical protein
MPERDSIRLLDLTRLWQFSRYMYSFGEYRLWVPISHRAVGYAIAVLSPVWLVLQALGVPWGGRGLTAHLVLPGALVWWALRVVGEGARPVELVGSWVRMGWLWVRGERLVPVVLRQATRSDVGRVTGVGR